MIAILTKYLGPTNYRGARIKAYSKNRSVTIPYDHALSDEMIHFEAVKAFAEKHLSGLDADSMKDMRFGGTEEGYAFCFAGSIVGK